ncbi:MAG: methyltransferase [Fastidiosipila sp.]|nr:methyltransferase [Fastidiosipila sp.]
MGGAWSVEQITEAFQTIGFARVTVVSEEVTEAYARKWGHGLAIREFIQSSLIYAEKPWDSARAPFQNRDAE